MPDWVAHILIGLILAEVFSLRPKSLVIIGSILPDILVKTELLSIFLPIDKYAITWFFIPLHTPFGMLLFSLLLIPLFQFDRVKLYYLLLVGWGSHLLADVVFNKHIHLGQNLLLFPFSWSNYELGLIWPDQYYILLIPLVLVYSIIMIHKYYKSSKALARK